MEEEGEDMIGAALPSPGHDPRTIVALSERVAIVETQQRGLKEDTGIIRATMHAFAQDMQKFVIAEQRCGDHLGSIAESMKELPAMAQAIAHFMEMRPDLDDVVKDRARREGIAAFGRRLAMIAGAGAALVAMTGGIVAALIWLIQHLKPL